METKKHLPSIQDITQDLEVAYKNDQLKLLLNQPPIQGWIKKNKYAGNTNYIPIDKIEYLLDRIFGQWKVEVKNVSPLFNSIAVEVRLHYINPTTNEWEYQDGVGAVGMQTDSGSDASNMNAIKQNAVQMGLPAAKSYAIKDAAEHLGDLFGRNINRKDTLPYKTTYEAPGANEIPQDAADMVAKADSLDEINLAADAFPELKGNHAFIQMLSRKSNELKMQTA